MWGWVEGVVAVAPMASTGVYWWRVLDILSGYISHDPHNKINKGLMP